MNSRFLLMALALISITASPGYGAVVYTDALDNDGTWIYSGSAPTPGWADETYSGSSLGWPSEIGVLTGNEAAYTHNVGNYTLSKEFAGSTWQPGDYEFSIYLATRQSHGWTSGGLSVDNSGSNFGFTANGIHVTPTATSTPNPTMGGTYEWLEWTYAYTVNPGDSIVGETIGASFFWSATTLGELMLDNITINFVPEPSTLLLAGLALALTCRRRI